MTESEKKEFLIASINDIQSTIRALDNKVIAVLVILLLPLSQVQALASVYGCLIKENPFGGILLLVVFALSWLLSFIYIFSSLIGKQIKKREILNDTNAKGLFYSNTQIYLSNHQTDLTNGDMINELSFEHLKLICIRKKKMYRHKIALIASVLSLVFLLAAWLPIVFKLNL